MTISNKIREQLLKMCGSLGDEDGTDARNFHEHRRNSQPVNEYRRLRLCQQVCQHLRLVLPESTSARVRDLRIAEVVPGKSNGLLIVRLVGIDDGEERTAALRTLRHQTGWLRTEVAAAIHRKRAPRLKFEFVATRPSSGGQS